MTVLLLVLMFVYSNYSSVISHSLQNCNFLWHSLKLSLIHKHALHCRHLNFVPVPLLLANTRDTECSLCCLGWWKGFSFMPGFVWWRHPLSSGPLLMHFQYLCDNFEQQVIKINLFRSQMSRRWRNSSIFSCSRRLSCSQICHLQCVCMFVIKITLC
jgi:hypothetical protein